MIGWKVMRYNSETGDLISGADKRISLAGKVGSRISMPGQGIWMSTNRQYVIEHYAVHDQSALIELDFDPECLIEGNITDNQPEFTVASAEVLSITILPGD